MIAPGEAARPCENEGAGPTAAGEAECLGITRFLNATYVVGGQGHTRLADAIAHGRRLQAARRT